MAKPTILAKITVQDGKRDELIAAFGRMLDHVRDNESGTEVYVLHTDDKDPNVVWFYEMYRDDQAFGVHANSDMMKEFGKVFGALVAGRPELIRLTPVGGKGVSV